MMSAFNSKKTVTAVFFSILAFYIFSTAYAVFSQKQFYADGAFFFISMIQHKSFMMDYPARQYGQYFTEFPLVFCLKYLHMTNFYMLSLIFGFGLYLPQMICLLICYRIVRNIDIRYMLFPLLSLFGISQNIFFNMINDCLALTYVFWPVLFFILFVREYKWIDIALLLFTAVIFMRSYESAFLIGFILLAILLTEMYQSWKTAGIKTNIIRGVLVMILINSSSIAVAEIMKPIDPHNRASFLRDITTVFGNYQAMLSAIYIFLIAALLSLKKFASSARFKYFAAVLFLITACLSFIPVIKPELAKPFLQHSSRSFHLYMLPLLCVLTYAVAKGIVRVSEISWQKAFLLCAFLVIGQMTWQTLMTGQWNGYRQIFREELSAREGYIRFEDTRLVNDKIGNQMAGYMTWGWTNPVLSILWSKDHDVTAIIANPAKRLRWEPFDPQDINALPKLNEYGFSYEKYIRRIKSDNQILKNAVL